MLSFGATIVAGVSARSGLGSPKSPGALKMKPPGGSFDVMLRPETEESHDEVVLKPDPPGDATGPPMQVQRNQQSRSERRAPGLRRS